MKNQPEKPQPEIVLSIFLDGTIQTEVVGAEGKTCTELTKVLEEALGTVEERKFKPEYRQDTVKTSQRLHLRQ